MNRAAHLPQAAHRRQALEARFGLRVAAALERRPVGHDIEERLRVAREQAVQRAAAQRRAVRASAPASVHNGGGTLSMGGSPWWLRLASLAPLMVLALGLILIEHLDDTERIRAAAEIDAVILADELPPQAYADPGFGEYLKQATP